jgi:hypothetical protein
LAGRNHIHTGGKQLSSDARCNRKARSGVFDITDNEINLVLLA